MSSTPSQHALDDVQVIGELPPHQAAEWLRGVGDNASADELLREAAAQEGQKGLFGSGKPKPWQHTEHQYGYIAPVSDGSPTLVPLQFAGGIEPDESLRGRRVDIRLDRLQVYDYPGGGEHQVLVTFLARNQLPNAPEPISFTQTYQVREGQAAGIAGCPILMGLGVGVSGVAFQGFAVNVKSAPDEVVLGVLDSPIFKQGL